MLGLGEKSGSGFQKILWAWKEQHWLIPLVAEDLDLDITRVWLPIASMIPADVERELRTVVGDNYRSLDELARVILMLTHRLGETSNEDIQHYRNEHPRDIGGKLKQLVTTHCLDKRGHGRGTRYRLPSMEYTTASSVGLVDSSEHLTDSSEHLVGNSEHLLNSSEHLTPEQVTQLATIADAVRHSGKVAKKALMEVTILELCSISWLSLQTLATLLNRKTDSLRNHYINPMLQDGRLRARMPDTSNHPQQAYKRA